MGEHVSGTAYIYAKTITSAKNKWKKFNPHMVLQSIKKNSRKALKIPRMNAYKVHWTLRVGRR